MTVSDLTLREQGLSAEPAATAARSVGRSAAGEDRLLHRLILIALLAVTAQRIWLGHALPLWLDETWTAVIAGQPTWADFWREAWLDCNAPLYYLVERLWIGVAGNSNAALRVPSAVFFYAAAAVPLVWRDHGIGARGALLWSAILLLWAPGVLMTVDARSYGLLMLISVCAVIAFARAWRQPSASAFLLWATLGALQMLTHYFAGFVVAAQGLLLLYRWRLTLLRRFFAFAPLAVPVAWTLYHLPRLRDYARPDVVWYEPTGFDQVAGYTVFTIGGWNPYFALVLFLALGGALWKSGWTLLEGPTDRAGGTARDDGALHAVLAGALALAAILVGTSLLSSLTERYLVPIVPSMLLGVVLLAMRIPRTDIALPFTVGIYAVFALNPVAFAKEAESRSHYGYERASDFIAEHRPRNLVFVWDHPAAKVLDRGSLAQIGEFFLERRGVPVKTQALVLGERDDPNAAIRAAVREPGTALLWLYNAERKSAARHFPPTFADDPAWRCLDRRRYLKKKGGRRTLEVGVIACVPSTKDIA